MLKDLPAPVCKRGMNAHILFHLRPRKDHQQIRLMGFSIARTGTCMLRECEQCASVISLSTRPSFLSSPLTPVQGITRPPRITHLSSRLASTPTFSNGSSGPPCPALGNFFLSSCPGKKGVAQRLLHLKVVPLTI